MIMKKILLSVAIGLCNQNFTASQHDKIAELYAKTSATLAQHKRHGKQIGDINQLDKKNNLVLEIHEAQAQDDLPELLANAQAQIFSRHLAHHFGRDEVLEFIKIVEEHSTQTIALIDLHIQQAAANYFVARQNPKVTPQSKTFIGYLTFLRDQNDE
jgi:hypothetical protein